MTRDFIELNFSAPLAHPIFQEAQPTMTTLRSAATAIFLAVALVAPETIHAFTAPKSNACMRPSSSLNVIPPELHDASFVDSSSQMLTRLTQELDKETARGEFYFFFFAGSGAGGIGLAQIPRIYGELKGIRDLAGEGPSEGGEVVNAGISAIFYPTMYRRDVEKVIAKVPSTATISAQGTSTSYLASKGYIDQMDFVASLKQCNPLASYALFEALSGGSGSVVSPDVLEENLAKYRSASDPVAAFASDLQSASLTKLGAYGGLGFLLFIVFALIIESGISAFL